ncbi:hypothetical protein ACFEOB_000287 [Salmonella enterica]|nr:hypothetical protein [Salmonella enterica]
MLTLKPKDVLKYSSRLSAATERGILIRAAFRKAATSGDDVA